MKEKLDQKLIDQYRDVIFKIKEVIDRDLTHIENEVIIPKILELTPEAKKEYTESHKHLIDLMNSEDELSNHTGMFAKQITYIPRFALLLEFVNNIYEDNHANVVSKESIKGATELSNYFISMAKNNKIENKQNTTLSEFINKHKEKPAKELAVLVSEKFPKVSKKDIADALDISRRTLYRYLKK